MDRCAVSLEISDHTPLYPDLANLVADYAVPRIDGPFPRLFARSVMNAYGLIALPDGIFTTLRRGNDTACVAVFDTDGVIVRTFGTFGRGPGQLEFPVSMCYDPRADELFVADDCAHRISVFTTDGTFLRSWGSNGIAADKLGCIDCIATNSEFVFVSRYRPSRISVFDTKGHFIRDFGRHQIRSAEGIAVWKGRLFVCDSEGHRVAVFWCHDGAFIRYVGGRNCLFGPFGITIWKDQLYVAHCALPYEVVVFDASDGPRLRTHSCPHAFNGDVGLRSFGLTVHNGIAIVLSPFGTRMYALKVD